MKEIFTRALEKKLIIKYNTEVLDVKKEHNKFIIITNNGNYSCDKLILAMGSKAAPKTGSDGKIYEILKNIGLKVNHVLPALVGLKSNQKYMKDWNGIRIEGALKLFVDDKCIKESFGEIQLTDYGISGICVFNLSSLASKTLYENKEVRVKINFFEENFYDFMNKQTLNLNLEETLESLFNYKLMNIFFKLSKVNKDRYWKDLSESDKRSLANVINEFNIKIEEIGSFERAQICTGGLSLDEINPRTMETNIKNLYVIGETLDVDGECGGFNLAFAFITGFIAGDLNA